MKMKKVRLEIVGLSYSQTQSGAYALVLGESAGSRRLPIIIGGFEAQAIAIELEKMKPTRPLTHDLFKSFAETFNVNVIEILIYNLVEGIFYAKLVCFTDHDTIEIDSRTSDALALAVRFGCPIYTYEHILENAGILMDEGGVSKQKIEAVGVEQPFEEQDDITKLDLIALEQLLQEVLESEDYIRAIAIRDEINKRKTK